MKIFLERVKFGRKTFTQNRTPRSLGEQGLTEWKERREREGGPNRRRRKGGWKRERESGDAHLLLGRLIAK